TPVQHAWAYSSRGLARTARGEWRAAEEDLRAGLRIWKEMGFDTTASHIWLTDLLRRQGRLEEARTLIDGWHDRALRPGYGYAIDYLQTIGELSLAAGELEQAAQSFNAEASRAAADRLPQHAARAKADGARVAAAVGDAAGASKLARAAGRLWAKAAADS